MFTFLLSLSLSLSLSLYIYIYIYIYTYIYIHIKYICFFNIISSQVALVKNPPANAGDKRDKGSIPGSGRSPGEDPLQYSCLENSMDRGAWQATYSPWGRKESDTTEAT